MFSFLVTLAAPRFRLEPQARQESRLVCNAFGARLHDAGLVASGKPQLGCPVGGRYSEEKGGSAQTYGYGARTGTRPRARPTIECLLEQKFSFHYSPTIYQKLYHRKWVCECSAGVAATVLWKVMCESKASVERQTEPDAPLF